MAGPDPFSFLGEDAPSEYEPGEGSNVDLGDDYATLARDLRNLPHRLDQALAVVAKAVMEIPELKRQHREEEGAAILRHVLKHGPLVAKKLAECECREVLFALETAEAERDVAKAALGAIETQISAAQTRARMWLAQFDEDRRTLPRDGRQGASFQPHRLPDDGRLNGRR